MNSAHKKALVQLATAIHANYEHQSVSRSSLLKLASTDSEIIEAGDDERKTLVKRVSSYHGVFVRHPPLPTPHTKAFITLMRHYRPEIDGLRAVAVLGVFFFHLNWDWVKGGWLGVDIFFVISGYLISSLLLNEIDTTGRVSLSGFYLRRVRRIMPALLAALCGSFFIALLFSRTSFFTQFFHSFLSALFSASNIFFWKHSGYFAIDSHLVPLLHTWTLGIEEQFYLIIPALFALIALCESKKRQLIWFAIFSATAVSFLACRYGQSYLSAEFRFYMLPTRMWELAIGTFCALLLHRYPHLHGRTILHQLLGISSVLFIGFAFTSYTGNYHFAEKSLFVTLATVVFIISVKQNSFAGWVFSRPPMLFVGRISYSLYLWHWPFIVLSYILSFKYQLPTGIITQIGILSAATLVATLSWKFVEIPFRRKNSWRECLKPMTPLASAVAACIAVSFMYLNGAGNKYILDESKYSEARYPAVLNRSYPRLGPSGSPQFMVIGDSHARAAGIAFADLATQFKVPGVIGTHSSTFPLINVRQSKRINDPPFSREWFRYIRDVDIKHVVMVAHWNSLLSPKQQWITTTDGERLSFRRAQKELKETIKRLLDERRTVWVLDQVPEFKKDPILAVRLISDDYTEKHDSETTGFIEMALSDSQSSRLHILDASSCLLEENVLRPVRENHFLYSDSNHLTPQGAREITQALLPLFEQLRRDAEERKIVPQSGYLTSSSPLDGSECVDR